MDDSTPAPCQSHTPRPQGIYWTPSGYAALVACPCGEAWAEPREVAA